MRCSKKNNQVKSSIFTKRRHCLLKNKIYVYAPPPFLPKRESPNTRISNLHSSVIDCHYLGLDLSSRDVKRWRWLSGKYYSINKLTNNYCNVQYIYIQLFTPVAQQGCYWIKCNSEPNTFNTVNSRLYWMSCLVQTLQSAGLPNYLYSRFTRVTWFNDIAIYCINFPHVLMTSQLVVQILLFR